MARDYAKSNHRGSRKAAPKSKRGAQKQTRPFAWLSVGFIAGVLVTSVIYFQRSQILESSSNLVQATIKKVQPKQKIKKTKPRFDFYTVLKEDQKTVPVYQEPKRYIIQIASFKKFADADRLKAQLTLDGLVPSIKTVSSKNQRWYRVFLGPYDSKKVAIKTQRELEQKHVKSILRTVS